MFALVVHLDCLHTMLTRALLAHTLRTFVSADAGITLYLQMLVAQLYLQMLVSHCKCSRTCLAGVCIGRYLYSLFFHCYLTCMPGPCFLIVCLGLASCLYVLPCSRSVCVRLNSIRCLPDLPTLLSWHHVFACCSSDLSYTDLLLGFLLLSCPCLWLVSSTFQFVCMSSYTPGKKGPHHLVRRMRE